MIVVFLYKYVEKLFIFFTFTNNILIFVCYHYKYYLRGVDIMLEKVLAHDELILIKINKGLRCSLFNFLMPKATYLGSIQFCICISVISIFVVKSPLKIILPLIVSALICNLIKFIVGRTRPFLVIKDLYINKIGIDKYSFPSGHTTAAFSLATSFCFLIPHLAILFILLALIVAFSRLYLGVHYVTDVSIGMIIGVLINFLINLNM